MRLVSFNLMHGRTLSDGRIEPGRLAAAIARLDADVLGLQELDRGQPRTGGRDLTAEVAKATGAGAEARFVPTVIGVPGSTRGGSCLQVCCKIRFSGRFGVGATDAGRTVV